MRDVTDEKVPPRRGHRAIQGYLKTIDRSPGVYRMLGEKGDVLYVGKARNLKARVSSYARPAGHSPRIARMISETASMMVLTTGTELEALLLRCLDKDPTLRPGPASALCEARSLDMRTLEVEISLLPLKGPEGLVDRILGLYQPLEAGTLNGRPVVHHSLSELRPALLPEASVNVFALKGGTRPARAANDRL